MFATIVKASNCASDWLIGSTDEMYDGRCDCSLLVSEGDAALGSQNDFLSIVLAKQLKASRVVSGIVPIGERPKTFITFRAASTAMF